jgi:hypothetical protein
MAARYRKIDPRIWNDEKFRLLSDDGKLVFLFVLTHPHMTALGAMRATVPGLAAELGWKAERFESAAAETISQGIVEHCKEASWVGIPNFLRYNEPEGPNSVTKAWASALNLLPECHQKSRLIQRCRVYLEAKSQPFKHAIGKAIWDVFSDTKSNPSGIPEQELKPELEQDQEQEEELKDTTGKTEMPHKRSKEVIITPMCEKAPRRKSALPENFELTRERRQYAIIKGIVDPEGEFEHFQEHHRKNDSHYADWDAAWHTWVLNTVKHFGTKEPHGKHRIPHSGYTGKNYRDGAF